MDIIIFNHSNIWGSINIVAEGLDCTAIEGTYV